MNIESLKKFIGRTDNKHVIALVSMECLKKFLGRTDNKQVCSVVNIESLKKCIGRTYNKQVGAVVNLFLANSVFGDICLWGKNCFKLFFLHNIRFFSEKRNFLSLILSPPTNLTPKVLAAPKKFKKKKILLKKIGMKNIF